MSSLSLKSRALSAGRKLLQAYDKYHGGDLSWSNAAYVVLTCEKKLLFQQYHYAIVVADIDEEFFDSLLEEHQDTLNSIRHTLAKSCKEKLQEKLDAEGEIPMKLKKYMKTFPRLGLKVPVVNGNGNVPT